MIGAAVFSSRLGSDAAYTGAASRHFNYLTAEWEMKWDPIQRTPGVYDFSGGDRIVDFAESRGMRVKGHALVWHGATPEWVNTLSPPELRIAFEDHIRTVAGHYRRRVYAWDVVNEAIDDSQPGLRSTVFSRGLGPDYVAEAFRLARQADPEAQLFYNDYGGEGLNRKSNDVYNLVKDLKERGLVDGVGLQMHISATSFPAVADIQANIQRLADLGLAGQPQRDGRARQGRARGTPPRSCSASGRSTGTWWPPAWPSPAARRSPSGASPTPTPGSTASSARTTRSSSTSSTGPSRPSSASRTPT